ncbi:MAG: hypothetical protein WAL38_09075 [Solirubrobacteraceae bacterium]
MTRWRLRVLKRWSSYMAAQAKGGEEFVGQARSPFVSWLGAHAAT